MFGSQTRPGMRGTSSLGSLGGCSIAGSSLADDTLGARTYKLEPLGATRTYVLEPLGAAGGSDPFQTFGRRAAALLVGSVQQLPAAQRSTVMRQVMARIDPTLPARAETLTAKARSRGMAPAAALQHGIASAMTSGVIGELAQLGRTRRAPKPGSLLGLGAVNVFTAGTTTTAAAMITCAGYSWDGAAWVRTPAGQADIPGPGKGCPTVQSTPLDPGGGATVTETNPTGKYLQVGPFKIPMVDRYGIRVDGALPADWNQFILEELSTDCKNCINSSMVDSGPGTAYGRLRDFFPALPARINHDFVSLRSGGPRYLPGTFPQIPNPAFRDDGLPGQPIAITKRPDTGQTWGFYMYVQPKDLAASWNSITNPYILFLEWREVNVGVWDWIKNVVSTISDAIGDAIGDLVCGLINKPGASTAVATTGPVGIAAGAGIEIAKSQGACQPEQPPPAAGGMGGWILPVAIAGGALVVVLALTKKRS